MMSEPTHTIAGLMALVDEFAFAAGKSAIGVYKNVPHGSPDHLILAQAFNTTRDAVEAYARAAAESLPEPARKVGGSYEAEGYIVSRFVTTTGQHRVVFEFSEPAGMLHIFAHHQIAEREVQS